MHFYCASCSSLNLSPQGLVMGGTNYRGCFIKNLSVKVDLIAFTFGHSLLNIMLRTHEMMIELCLMKLVGGKQRW